MLEEVKACDLCGSLSHHLFLVGRRGERLVRCADCQFVFLNPRMLDEDQADLEIDDLWLKEEPWRRRDDALRLDEIQLTHRGGRLLDVGSYCGFFLDEARRRGFEVTGVELAPKPAEYARHTFGLTVFTGTVAQAPIQRGSLDVVTMFHVLEHMSSPSESLTRIADLLRPGGLLVVEVPRLNALVARLMGRYHRHIGFGHAVYFTDQSLAKALKQHGFSVEAETLPARRMSVAWMANRLTRSMPLGTIETGSALVRRFPSAGTISVSFRDILRVRAIRN